MPTVNLESSRRSRPFTVDKERLWARDLEDLVELIQNHIKALDEHLRTRKGTEKEKLKGAPNLSIAVFGPAGSGKSSLLKTLVYECQKEKDEKPDAYKGMASLDVLQPARFSEHDNLLFATVAAALDAHRKNEGERTFEYERTTAVLNAYRDLDEHLRVVLKEEMPKDLDPHALAAEYIQRHTSALNLKEKIDIFLEKLAENLNGRSKASVVLLPVDDLDLNHDHLHKGLRHLQAYLLHPRIVPVFCFTDRLAEEILTGSFAGSLKEADDTRQRGERLAVSEQLAVQHLAKCFPVRNRIRLGPIPATLQGSMLQSPQSSADTKCECCGQKTRSCKCEDSDRSSKKKKENGQPVIQTLVAASYLLFGVPDRDARHPVRAALRPSTLRRQFHVIDAMRGAKVEALINHWMNSTILKPHRVKGNRISTEVDRLGDIKKSCTELFDDATWGLMNVHRDVLREFGLHLEDLLSWTPHALRRVMLQALFKLPSEKQIALWQRWQDLTDSRRSQVISLLAANIHRPWVENERPSGENYIQIALWKDGKLAVEHPTEIPASMALLWLLEILVGFYLPLSRSVERVGRERRKRKPAPLSPSGWTLHSAPVQAALSADDDGTLLSTGMMFLDPLSYAAALTTAPRIAAFRALDESSVSVKELEVIKKAKVAYLSLTTRNMLDQGPDKPSGKLPEFLEACLETNSAETKSDKLHPSLCDSYKVFRKTANWEIGKDKGPVEVGNAEITELLKRRDYLEALKKAKEAKNKKDEESVARLMAAAETVHDDQLLLRIWTCYGFNRGHFWAAVSFWRGLGLIGQLIEGHRRWYEELNSRYGFLLEEGSDGEERAREKIEHETKEKIRGALRAHSLRGLVPGQDLGGGSHRGLMELAFPGWDSAGQKGAIDRLAERLLNWLEYNRDYLRVKFFQEGLDEPRWSRCFVRRLHGGYAVASLWQWLDAEHLEHQGRQYAKGKSYYWNAGVALTSWFRVLQKYLWGNLEIRWLLETCPLTSPILSRSASDPLLESLQEKSYSDMLRAVAKSPSAVEENSGVYEVGKIRRPADLKGLATELEKEWWRPEDSDANGINGITRNEVETTVKRLLSPDSPDVELVVGLEDRLKNLAEHAKCMRRALTESEWEALLERDKELGKRIWFKAALRNFCRNMPTEENELKRLIDELDEDSDGVERAVQDPEGKDYRTRCRKLAQFIKKVGAADLMRIRRPDKAPGVDQLTKRIMESYRPQGDRDENGSDKVYAQQSTRFERASIIQQHLKLMAHASATSLFYQIPRVHRDDFFRKEDHDPKDRKCCCDGEAET